MGAHPATVKFTKAIDGLDSFGFPLHDKTSYFVIDNFRDRAGPGYLVLAIDDSTSLLGQVVAIPLRQFKLDDSPDHVVVVLPGASRTAVAKLPVYVGH
jgi:hypothetical protein